MLVMPPREKARRKHEEYEKCQNQIIIGLLNGYDTEKVISDNATVEDCIEAPLKELKIYGKEIKQETSQGYNLLNPKDLQGSASINFDNDILTISSSGTFGNVYVEFLNILKKNVGKTLYFIAEDVDFSNAKAPRVQIRCVKDGETSYINLASNKTGNITLPEDISGITSYRVTFYSNNTNEEGSYSAIWKKPMLVLEEDADKPYERFGQSPSINYPSLLEYVEGSQKVEHLKINLLPNFRSTITTQGKTFTANEDGSVTTSGISTAYCQAIDSNSFLLKAGTYTFWNNLITNYFQTQLRSEDGLKIYVNSTSNKTVFSLAEDTILKYRIICQANISTNQTIKSMILLGDYTNKDNIEYQEYQSKTYQIDLTNNGLYSENDCIYYNKEQKKYFVHNEWGKEEKPTITYKHTTLVTDEKGLYKINLPNKFQSNDFGSTLYCKCDYLKARSGSSSQAFNNNDDGIWWENNSNSVYLILPFKTTQEAQSWIDEVSLSIAYKLENPTDTEITSPVLIKQLDKLRKLLTYKGTNHFIITSENGQSANLEVTAYKNTFKILQNKIDKLETKIDALIIDNA